MRSSVSHGVPVTSMNDDDDTISWLNLVLIITSLLVAWGRRLFKVLERGIFMDWVLIQFFNIGNSQAHLPLWFYSWNCSTPCLIHTMLLKNSKCYKIYMAKYHQLDLIRPAVSPYSRPLYDLRGCLWEFTESLLSSASAVLHTNYSSVCWSLWTNFALVNICKFSHSLLPPCWVAGGQLYSVSISPGK